MLAISRKGLAGFVDRLSRHWALSPNEREKLLRLPTRTTEVKPRKHIVAPGQATVDAFLVIEGIVGRIEHVTSDRKQITALFLPGDICELHTANFPKVKSSLTALTRATVAAIPRQSLSEAAAGNPGIAMAFWSDASAKGSILAKWLSNLGRKEATARVAHLLCEIGVRFERAGVGRKAEYQLALSQRQIADATGLTMVHVNRVFRSLRETGLVDYTRPNLRIDDWDRLVELAEFDDHYLLKAKVPA